MIVRVRCRCVCTCVFARNRPASDDTAARCRRNLLKFQFVYGNGFLTVGGSSGNQELLTLLALQPGGRRLRLSIPLACVCVVPHPRLVDVLCADTPTAFEILFLSSTADSDTVRFPTSRVVATALRGVNATVTAPLCIVPFRVVLSPCAHCTSAAHAMTSSCRICRGWVAACRRICAGSGMWCWRYRAANVARPPCVGTGTGQQRGFD